MKPQHGIRRGDRYTSDDLRITVTEVTDNLATIQVLQVGTGTRWSKLQQIPFPAGFIKVFSAHPRSARLARSSRPRRGWPTATTASTCWPSWRR